MSLTGAKLRDLVRKTLGFGADSTDDALVDKALCRVRYQTVCPTAWATAGTDTGIPIIGAVDRQFLIDAVYLITPSAVAVSESVMTTLTFSKSDSAGANLTTVATAVNNAAGIGATVALVPSACTLTATKANLLVAAGWVLSCVKTHASTGSAIPDGSLLVVEGFWI
jgi:hypothetical protein